MGSGAAYSPSSETVVSGKHNLRGQQRDCLKGRSLCATACQKQGVFWSLKNTGRQRQKTGKDQKMQLDRYIYQETQKKIDTPRQRKLEISRDQQTHQPLKPREREMWARKREILIDKEKDIKRGGTLRTKSIQTQRAWKKCRELKKKEPKAVRGEWEGLNLTETELRESPG